MKASELYIDLLKNPNASPIYRQLRDYYQSKGMHTEADAFTALLQECFNILPEWGWKPHHESEENLNPDSDS